VGIASSSIWSVSDAWPFRRPVKAAWSKARRSATPRLGHTVEIDGVHVFRASSAKVQAGVGGLLREVGFREEVVHTPQAGFTTRSRADFAYRLGEGRGIIAEIERGGTTTNNHDLKDFWKVHIAADAHHLFLVVPMANWKENGSARERPFHRVSGRIAAFFGDPRREVDVLSAHVFGYGSETPLGTAPAAPAV